MLAPSVATSTIDQPKLRLAESAPSDTVTVTWCAPIVRAIPVMSPDALFSDNSGGKPLALNFNAVPSGSLADKASDTFAPTVLVWLAG